MNDGRIPTVRPTETYRAVCNDRGYVITEGRLVVKTYRLAAICWQLSPADRLAVSVEFAMYDMANASFMLN